MVNVVQNRKDVNINRSRVHFDDTMSPAQAANFISVFVEQNPTARVMVWALGAWLVVDESDIVKLMEYGATTDNIRVVVEGMTVKLIQG
jgi:hypothetical protein